MHVTYLVTLFALLPVSALMAQTYKWVDQNGVVSYSQTPPGSNQAEEVTIKPAVQSDSTSGSEELDRLRQQLEDRREDRQLAAEAAKKAKAEAEIKRKNCDVAHSNLDKLQNSGNRMIKTTEGEYIRLTESERQQRMQTAHDQIKANCNANSLSGKK